MEASSGSRGWGDTVEEINVMLAHDRGMPEESLLGADLLSQGLTPGSQKGRGGW